MVPPAVQALHSFIAQSGYPCVGAKAALARGGIETLLCGPITSSWDDAAITRQLVAFARRWRARPRLFASFVVIFDRGPPLTERQFETALWARLQSFTSRDRWLGFDHDPRVSSDPANPDFALSFGGEAFFAIGLHPGASRRSRRFRQPAIVFNLHAQFRQLRAEGRFETMRNTILARDLVWSGSAKPMLARHGEQSEARQYSGRRVEAEWTCPYHR